MDNKASILLKIRKLLSLSNSDNVNEAALAAARAQELMDKYGIEKAQAEIQTGFEDPEEKEDIKNFSEIPEGWVDTSQKMTKWKIHLFCGIAKYNSCKGFSSYRGQGRSIEVIGRPSDVETTRYMYTYIMKEICNLRNKNSRGLGKTWSNNFCIGAVQGILERINESRNHMRAKMAVDAQRAGGTALMVLDKAIAKVDKKLADVETFTQNNLKLQYTKGPTIRYNSTAREVGKQASKSISLSSSGGRLGSGQKALTN